MEPVQWLLNDRSDPGSKSKPARPRGRPEPNSQSRHEMDRPRPDPWKCTSHHGIGQLKKARGRKHVRHRQQAFLGREHPGDDQIRARRCSRSFAGPAPHPAASAITSRTAPASLRPDDRSLSTESRTPTVRRAEATTRTSWINRARVLEVPPSSAITRDQARTIAGSLRVVVVRMFLAFLLPSVAGRAMLNETRVVTISQNGPHRDPGRDRSSG